MTLNTVENTETTLCPMCAGNAPREAYQFPPYTVVHCARCGFFYLSPRLKEACILELYQDDSYYKTGEYGYSSYISQEASLRATFRRLLHNLKKNGLAGGRLLEVGCGYGYFLEEARPYFEHRVGTDFSPEAVRQAQQRADQVFEGGTQQIPTGMEFACIVSINVIEHLYHPEEFLRDLGRHLKPGGQVVIATPNIDSFIRSLMGRRWPSFKIPEHVLYFNQKSLAALMEKAGLSDLHPLPFPHAFPLALIASKLHARLPEGMGKINVWVPTTMVAMYGTFASSHD